MISSECIKVANCIITKTKRFNFKRLYSQRISMTCKRLQKLLYFCEIEYMKTHNGKAMFDDRYHAWPNGPAIPSVYDVFVQGRVGEMDPVNFDCKMPLDAEKEKVVDKIVKLTCEIDTIDLVKVSCAAGSPWIKVYNENDPHHEQTVSKEEMYACYKDVSLSGIIQ